MESSIIWVNKEKGGSCNGVIGSSGSGKSTLLHTIAGVNVPTKGKSLDKPKYFHPNYSAKEMINFINNDQQIYIPQLL